MYAARRSSCYQSLPILTVGLARTKPTSVVIVIIAVIFADSVCTVACSNPAYVINMLSVFITPNHVITLLTFGHRRDSSDQSIGIQISYSRHM
jgi:hypothetical protein